MRKFFRTLHTWLSIPAGILIFIVCFTGTLLVFQDEIQQISNKERYFNSEKGKSLIPLNQLAQKVNEKLKDNSVKDVRIYSNHQRNYAFGLTDGFRKVAYVNPYTAEITDIYSPKDSIFFWIMSLHRWLLDDTRTWGKYAVGISTLFFIVILISGFFIWLPKKWKRSRFTIETQKGKKRLFYDLHSVLGLYACLILLISAITGPMWSFEWYRNSVYTILGAETSKPEAGNKEKDKKNNKVNFEVWPRVADTLQTLNPDNEYITIQNGSAMVHQKNAATSRASDKYQYEPKTGSITSFKPYKQQPYSSKIPGWYYDLHVGAYWGIWSKILTFIAGLIGTSLPITGYYLWWKKRRKKHI